MVKYVKMPKLPENLHRRLIEDLKEQVGDCGPAKYVSKIELKDKELSQKVAYHLAKALRGETQPADLKYLAYVADLDILDDCARFYLRWWENMTAETEDSLLKLADFSNRTEEEHLFNEVSKKTALEQAWKIGV